MRVAAGAVGQAERELEPVGFPFLLFGEVPRPDVEIGAHVRDLVAPDAIDSGDEFLGVFGCDPIESRIQNADGLSMVEGRWSRVGRRSMVDGRWSMVSR